MGHEYCGFVEEVGSAVKAVKPGQFVIGSFCISDNTCPNCRAGYQSGCQQLEFMTRAQAPYARVPLADGTLVATQEKPSNDLLPSLLAVSDVLGTGLQLIFPPSNFSPATPVKRRGKSMSRRTGQTGHIEKSGKWWVIRWWMDVPGQEKRVLKRAKLCPIAGPGALSASERKRRGRILQQSCQGTTRGCSHVRAAIEALDRTSAETQT